MSLYVLDNDLLEFSDEYLLKIKTKLKNDIDYNVVADKFKKYHVLKYPESKSILFKNSNIDYLTFIFSFNKYISDYIKEISDTAITTNINYYDIIKYNKLKFNIEKKHFDSWSNQYFIKKDYFINNSQIERAKINYYLLIDLAYGNIET